MATYTQLRSRLRETKVVESATTYFTDAILLRLLGEAAAELNAAFGLNHVKISGSTTASVVTINTSLTDLVAVTDISVNGFKIPLVNRGQLEFLQQLPATKYTRGYYWDPRERAAAIEIGPPLPNTTQDWIVDGILWETLPESATTGGSPWGGDYQDFEDLVVLLAAVKAAEMDKQYDEAQYHFQRFMAEAQGLARLLRMELPHIEPPANRAVTE